MVKIDPLYELVQIVTDFLPVIIVIAAVLFFISLLFMMLPSKGGITNKLRIDKKMLYPMFGLMLLLLSSMGASGGTAAVGITVDSTVQFGGTVMTIKLTGLTVDSEYTIWASGNSQTFNNITLSASATEVFVPAPVLDDSDGYTLSVGASTAGVAATADATLFISPRDIGDFFPIDFFFNLLVPLILILVVVGITVSFVQSKSMNKGRNRD